MKRENVLKLRTDPTWAGAYSAALAEAESIGVDTSDAIAFAETQADLAVAKAEAKPAPSPFTAAEEAALIEAANAGLAQQKAEEEAERQARAAALTHAGWQRAFAGAGSTVQPEADDNAKGEAPKASEASDDKPDAGEEKPAGGWAGAFGSITQ